MPARLDARWSPYLDFTRGAWSELRSSTPLTLSEADLEQLRGITESLSMQEVEAIYLPLSRLLNFHIAATQDLHEVTSKFLGSRESRVPYVIGVAGSVSVGKSTTARVLQALLSRWPEHPRVALVTTDGFLHPNRVLEQRGMMDRKGFPGSYDVARLLQFVSDVKSGRSPVEAPVYSHLAYDIVQDERIVIGDPDILILEGLNVLQTGSGNPVFVSDFFDFSIYVDAEEQDLLAWFLTRFLTLRKTAFRDPRSFFRTFADLTEDEAVRFATDVWNRINLVNLRENILPTRERAHLILEKSSDHSVRRIRLRKP